jgi:hypothetical protein
MSVRVLSFHAEYGCRNSGVCCTSRWPVPDDRGGLLPTDDHGCVFHDAGLCRCRWHLEHGHASLPLACRQFPRVSIADPRGASVTLSCYCTTARAMLDESAGARIGIVTDGAGFPADGEYDGLDARASLPPALTSSLLMDWESWWRFEARAVALCNRPEPLAAIVRRISDAAVALSHWSPGRGALVAVVDAAFDAAEAMPMGDTAASWPTGGAAPEALRRFLACHVFANWTAHLGDGLHAYVRSLETVVWLLDEGWSVAAVDEWLRHYANPTRLAAAWSRSDRR